MNDIDTPIEANDSLDLSRRQMVKLTGAGAAALAMTSVLGGAARAQDMSNGADNFYTSDKVTVQKVAFKDQYQMKVGGNLFIPRTLNRHAKNAAIIVGHPMGAVKEQSANLYATKMAEQGFVTLSVDLPFWGDSEGKPRNMVAPEMYAEAFSAAVDFLGTQPFIDSNRIGVIGVCSETPPIQREFYDFYRTPRGEFTPKGSSPKLTTHPTLTSNVKFMNFYPFNDIETISPRPMLFITGEIAHSREFSEDAYRLAAEPKELVVIPGAGHVDLYDRTKLIPFNKLANFFTPHLK